MISSVFALKESDTIPEYLVSNTETKLEENYYINSTLNFLLECQEELLSYKKDFYKTILEASEDDPYAINESYTEILSKIKAIIKKILAYIESLIKRFTTQLAKFVRSDKYIIKKKKEIEKFPRDKSFTISGFEFTIDDNIPLVDIVGLDLSEVQDKIKSINDEDIVSKIAELSELLMKISDAGKMDDIRGQILNVNYPIPETNFGNEIFSIYRDGKSEESDIIIKKEDVTRALKDFEGYNSKIKEVKRLQGQIATKYKALERQVESVATSEMNLDGSSKINNAISSGKYSAKDIDELKRTLNNLVNSQVNQIQRISNLHVQAVAAKLDAYNALVIQDRNILYRALSTVQKDIDNTRMMRESYTNYDYTREAYYRNYVLEKYYMNQNQKHFVEECLALSESNIPELKTIHEDLKMDKQNMFEKLKATVKTIFEKFMMKMNQLIVNDEKFLTKYKDVILTKKIEEYTLNNMPEYHLGIKNIKDHKLVKLDIKNMISETEVEIQKKLLTSYNGDGEFADFAKRYFLCDNKPNREEVKSTDETIDMKELYAFCIGAKAAITTLKNDLKEFETAANTVTKEVLNSLPKSESVTLYGEKYYYSQILESYINEEEQQPNETEASGDANNTTKLKLDVPSQDTKAKENNNLDKDVKSDDKGKDEKTQAAENKNGDSKKIEETGKWYLNTIRTITTAKITAFQKIYSEYMKILRYHVKQATGSLGNASKFSEEDVTNIKNSMKEYNNAKNDEERNAAADKIIGIYKSKNMVIDRHDVQTLVNNNKNNLE